MRLARSLYITGFVLTWLQNAAYTQDSSKERALCPLLNYYCPHPPPSAVVLNNDQSVAETVGGDNYPAIASSCASRDCRVPDEFGGDVPVIARDSDNPMVNSGLRAARPHQHVEQVPNRRRKRPPGVAARGAAVSQGGTTLQTARTSGTAETGSYFASRVQEGGDPTGVLSGAESESGGGGGDDDGTRRINPPVLSPSAGAIRVPAVFSPTPSPSSAGGGGSAATASVTNSGGNSVGSGGGSSNNNNIINNNNNNYQRPRKRIAATPVWKRPVVPLSKPYVPVPRKDVNSRFAVS